MGWLKAPTSPWIFEQFKIAPKMYINVIRAEWELNQEQWHGFFFFSIIFTFLHGLQSKNYLVKKKV